jgi:ABC-type transport system involved in cytochrome bd biosynthesis fused ATPase/permease subunit
MDKHTAMGVFVGGIFAATIASIAALDGLAASGFVLLASLVFGLAAGLCIGGLIAANFAMLATEEKEKEEDVAHSPSASRAAA